MEKIAMNEEGEVVLIALESFTMLSILINFFCFLVMLEDKIVEAWICLGHIDHLLVVKWELFQLGLQSIKINYLPRRDHIKQSFTFCPLKCRHVILVMHKSLQTILVVNIGSCRMA